VLPLPSGTADGQGQIGPAFKPSSTDNRVVQDFVACGFHDRDSVHRGIGAQFDRNASNIDANRAQRSFMQALSKWFWQLYQASYSGATGVRLFHGKTGY